MDYFFIFITAASLAFFPTLAYWKRILEQRSVETKRRLYLLEVEILRAYGITETVWIEESTNETGIVVPAHSAEVRSLKDIVVVAALKELSENI